MKGLVNCMKDLEDKRHEELKVVMSIVDEKFFEIYDIQKNSSKQTCKGGQSTNTQKLDEVLTPVKTEFVSNSTKNLSGIDSLILTKFTTNYLDGNTYTKKDLEDNITNMSYRRHNK